MKRPQRGWSVAEFMVAMVLGLLLCLLASGLLAASGSNYRNHHENAWLEEGGRHALQIMAQSVRQAGYVNWDRDTAPPELEPDTPAAIDGLDAASIGRNSEGISVPLPSVANGSDVLAVRFSGAGGGSTGDGSSLNCAGFGVAGDTRAWSIFYLATDDGGENELRCKYRSAGGWGADAIVRGVDSFQVLYGLDTDVPADGVPNTYLNASAIRALDAAAPAEQHWKRVCSVRLALLLHGEHNTRADTVDTRFDLFGPAYADGRDIGTQLQESRLPPSQRLRARKVFSMTVALRNRGG
ncbi:PilW family protein [Duganella callida]|uniref:Pilus assembly protein PilW n=1 Tax=Duganella callida TaxID=2561932 RepID=A0A4Y9SHI0_9BURK|nr:PilW family protein [Duganella callida]TFW20893.1 pilus assembly protein PilW [Duganella callida]